MVVETPFEDTGPPAPATERFLVELDGYAGPIDVLLDLAREQKVDLVQISILELADQYLAFVTHARTLRLELAADYLVMAAWLAYLKSRLLLPQSEQEGEQPSGAEMAAALRFQLQRLEAMRDAAVRLMARPQLGLDVFLRGQPDGISVISRPAYDATLYDLLKAYGDQRRRREAGDPLRFPPIELHTIEDAIQRIAAMLGGRGDWRSLTSFLPAELGAGVVARSALASTFSAGLEMARMGALELRQTDTYGPIYVRGKRRRE